MKSYLQAVFLYAAMLLFPLVLHAQILTYNPAGQLTKVNYANGITIKYKYDPSGNLRKAIVNPLITATISADEPNGSSIRFEVKRTGDMSNSLTVALSGDGDAVSGNDYKGLPETVVIPAHESSTSFVIAVQSNRPSRAAKDLTLRLAESDDYELNEHSSVTVTLPEKR